MERLKKDNGKKHNSNGIFMKVNNEWLLVDWEIAKWNNMITEDFTLLHLDTYLNDVAHSIEDLSYLITLNQQEINPLTFFDNSIFVRDILSSYHGIQLDNLFTPLNPFDSINDLFYAGGVTFKEVGI